MNRQERRRKGILRKDPMISIKSSDIKAIEGGGPMNKIKTVEMDENFQEILISAVRYALGRMTYIVSLTVDYITPMIRNLDLKYINIMIDDIDRQREYGMDMDKDEWMKLLGRLRAERERRFKNGNYR